MSRAKTIYWFILVLVIQPLNILIMLRGQVAIGAALFILQMPFIIANYRGTKHNKAT